MKATGDWKGLRVTVKLTVINRQATVCAALHDGLGGWPCLGWQCRVNFTLQRQRQTGQPVDCNSSQVVLALA